MARIIDDYGQLKEEVAAWLNRSDLEANIPTFIYLAERKIFRRYRMPNNEKTVTYNFKEDPQYDSLGSGNSANELELTDELDTPDDYLETLSLQWEGKPMKRISLTEMQRLKNRITTQETGTPVYFCRERGKMTWWPYPSGDGVLRWIYYCDLSGGFEEDTDDNDVLRVAPDLYLYGALLQAQPFLKPESDEWNLIPVWQQYYDAAFQELEYQRDEDERSGSNVEMKSGYHKESRGSVISGY